MKNVHIFTAKSTQINGTSVHSAAMMVMMTNKLECAQRANFSDVLSQCTKSLAYTYLCGKEAEFVELIIN